MHSTGATDLRCPDAADFSQYVEQRYPLTRVEQKVDHVTSYQTGTAGDQYGHEISLSPCPAALGLRTRQPRRLTFFKPDSWLIDVQFLEILFYGVRQMS